LAAYREVLNYQSDNIKIARKIDLISQKIKNSKAKAKKVVRKNTIALFESGIKFYKMENYKEAIKAWQKVLDINPSDQKAKDYIKRAKTKLSLMGN
jgi:cytochrome c-type biogenesis protein CcmH/NrfG